MKKFLLLLFTLFVLQTVHAQPYYPMLDSVNTWRYIGNGLTVRPHDVPDFNCSYPFMADYGPSSMYTAQDTVINSKTYKVIIAAPDWSSPCTYGYLREDTALRKIYFLDVNGNPEVLLYNFSMQVGDTMTINFPYGGVLPNGLYHLNSIVSVNTNAGVRRVFSLKSNTCSGCDSISWIESVGSPYDLVYRYASYQYGNWFNCPGPQHHLGHFLSCFTHAQEVYVDSCAAAEAANNPCYQFLDSCTYGFICGSVPELHNTAFTISPNPARENFTISSNYALSKSQMEIYNVFGEVVYLKHVITKQETIDCSALKPGIYFARLSTGEKIYTQKLVIE